MSAVPMAQHPFPAFYENWTRAVHRGTQAILGQEKGSRNKSYPLGVHTSAFVAESDTNDVKGTVSVLGADDPFQGLFKIFATAEYIMTNPGINTAWEMAQAKDALNALLHGTVLNDSLEMRSEGLWFVYDARPKPEYLSDQVYLRWIAAIEELMRGLDEYCQQHPQEIGDNLAEASYTCQGGVPATIKAWKNATTFAYAVDIRPGFLENRGWNIEGATTALKEHFGQTLVQVKCEPGERLIELVLQK